MALSTAALRAFLSRNTEEVPLYLLTIEHDDLDDPIRLVRNSAEGHITSNGDLFTAAPYDIDLPTDGEGAPVCKLQAPNVDNAAGEALELISTPAVCKIQVALASSPDTVEIELLRFELVNADWDSGFLTADLSQAQIVNEPFPAAAATPQWFPALLRV